MKHSKPLVLGFLFVSVTVALWLHVAVAAEGDREELARDLRGEGSAAKGEAAETDEKIDIRGETPEELQQAYAKALESLLPAMGSEDMEKRKASQQTFQDVCWHAGRPGAEVERAAVCTVIVGKLGPETLKPARIWLIRQLEYIGRAESVRALARLLEDKDALIRERARRALRNNPSPEAANAIRTALDQAKTPEWRVALINALGARKNGVNVTPLLKQAASDNDDVRSAAIAALAHIGDKSAADVIAAGMGKGSKHARGIAADSYLLLADRLCEGKDKATALTMYRRLLAFEGPPKCAAIVGLAQAGGVEVLREVLTALADPDKEVRGAGVVALQGMSGAGVTEALVAQLKNAAPEPKILLLHALAQRSDRSALPALLSSASDPDQNVRIAAYEGMGELADGRASAALVAALLKTEGSEHDVAAAALGHIRGSSVIDAITKAMATANPKGRVQLVHTLAARGSAGVVPALLDAAGDPDVTVRVESLKALGILADEKVLPSMIGLLVNAKEDSERAAAEEAAVAICRRVEREDRGAAPLLAAFPRAGVQARCSLLRVLGKVGGKEALKLVCSSLRDKDAKIQEAALGALGDWPDAESAPALLEVARTSTDDSRRLLALQGYVRVVGLPSERPAAETLKMYDEGMKAARVPAEKKLVLAGLGGVAELSALRQVKPYLADNALQTAAATATIKIAEAVSIKHRAEAEATLREVAEVCKDEKVQQQVKTAFQKVEMYDDYITAWLLSGPYSEGRKGNKELFDVVFSPEKPEEKNVKWRPTTGGADWSKAWKVDLEKILGGKNRVAYLRAWIRSDKTQKARLEMGSDDGLKVWLNGEVIHSANVNRGLSQGQDKVEVTLQAGWNALMLKVTQGGSHWAACARVRALDGSRLPGVLVMGDTKALETAAADLSDEALKAHAGQALVDMARVLIASHPAETKAALKKALEVSKDEALRKQISTMVAEAQKYEDYLTAWQVSGPYAQADADPKAMFDITFPPELAEHKGAKWAAMPAGADPHRPWLMDLEKVIGGTNCVAYLRTYLSSPKKQDAQLEIGSDDGVKAWLNGSVVLANNTHRPIRPAEDKVKVTLQEGWNSLVLKITQGGGHWSACARFRAPDGSHLEGLQAQAETPAGMKFIPVPEKKAPTPPPKPKEKKDAIVPPEDIEKITKAMPDKPRVKPARPRKLLLFSRTAGHRHGSIPWANKALQIMGKKTGAFEAVISDDISLLEPEKIQEFDAICFNNTTGNLFLPKDLTQLPKEQQEAALKRDAMIKKSIIDFVAGGKGIAGIHAATDCLYKWPEWGEMMGGYFWGHPWHEDVTIKVDDPGHPLCAAFKEPLFVVKDEIYQFRDPYSRDKLRVLLSLDTSKTNMDKGDKIRRTDGDFAVSWVRSYGKGRVFYCSLGHRTEIFWNPVVLQHYLDGIQFALGDLPADTTPSAKLPK